MTVGGSRVEGAPALSGEAAQFYTERCYLDQVSLGQLLELYQYREGKDESALARFVNELLGLEQLDALRSGLSDATDLRRLKKLSEPLADADAKLQRAGDELSRESKELSTARSALEEARRELKEALAAVGLEVDEGVDTTLQRMADSLRSVSVGDGEALDDLDRRLTTLGGRISALANRPSVQRLDETRDALDAATADLDAWRKGPGTALQTWRNDAADLDVSGRQLVTAIDDELHRIVQAADAQDELSASLATLEGRLEDGRARLLMVEADLSGAQVEAGTLVEGLAALRELAADDTCPVCDRDFGEVSTLHLTAHIDSKIAKLTSQGARLRELRRQRDSLVAEVQRDELALDARRVELWSNADREAAEARQAALADLRNRFNDLEPSIAAGSELEQKIAEAKHDVDELEAAARDQERALAELSEIADALGASPPEPGQSLQQSWDELAEFARMRLQQRELHQRASAQLSKALELEKRVGLLKDEVAEVAERKALWEGRLKEARRRQSLAREVQDASSKARAAIVQRVFTESLNEVWRGVFTRLAPSEPFVPTFGIPGTTKTALELTLKTVHASGESAGSPQMMLSAGNLNTAALSLFIALHLAVEPMVPCLVFDDPVQSMDEVHVAQLAALMRVLSKYHDRQLIVAVHERELFQYLSLELSPAFEGDELITIELGPRQEDDDRGITRHRWSPDPAIAV
jgi:exonuclease SbcC